MSIVINIYDYYSNGPPYFKVVHTVLYKYNSQLLFCCRVLRPLQQADSHANSRIPNAALQGNGFPVGNGAPPAAAPIVSKNKSLPSSAPQHQHQQQQQQQTARALQMNNAAVPTSIKAVSNASRALQPAAAPQSARSAEPIAAVAPVKESARAAAVQHRAPAAKVNGNASRVLFAAPAGGLALRAPALHNGANGDWETADHLDDDGIRENNGHFRVRSIHLLVYP